jgi:hypothetical protein
VAGKSARSSQNHEAGARTAIRKAAGEDQRTAMLDFEPLVKYLNRTRAGSCGESSK